MKRSKSVIGLVATALVLPLGAMTASATEVAPATAPTWTEWVSDDGGSAGREQPAISANGRFVVFVGRSSASGGVWVKDRLRPLTPAVQLATGFLFNPDISADGSTVAWAKYGSGSSGGQQVYTLKWRDPNATPQIASLGDDDQPAGAVTDFPSLSGNGRYVAFQSMDLTLDAQATGAQGGNRTKAYVRDTRLGTTEMVSVTDDEKVPNGSGIKPDITPDGRYVAFASDSTDLQGIESEEDTDEDGDTETTYQQIYRRDRVAKTTVPVSINAAGQFGDGASSASTGPSISDGGTRVAFESMATNLVTGDTNADTDVFVRKIAAGVTERLSVDANGVQADTDDTDDVAAGEVEDDPNTNEDESKAVDALPVGTNPAISGDAKYVAFMSTAPLLSTDANGVADIYRFGLADAKAPGLGRWSLVDVADGVAFEASGTRIDGQSGEEVVASNGADPTITYDGLRVAFVSQGNLTGRVVEEEEGEDTEAEPAAVTAIEPNVYLHRANPEPDSVLPTSRAKSPKLVTVPVIKVTYVKRDPLYPSSGVTNVRLYMRKPGQTRFWWVATEGPKGDGVFRVNVKQEGRYAFFTRAKDKRGNLEFMPKPARRDTVTLFRR